MGLVLPASSRPWLSAGPRQARPTRHYWPPWPRPCSWPCHALTGTSRAGGGLTCPASARPASASADVAALLRTTDRVRSGCSRALAAIAAIAAIAAATRRAGRSGRPHAGR